MHIEAKLEEMGLVLPAPGDYTPSTGGPPVPVLVRGNVAYVSGCSARNPDGTPYPVTGRFRPRSRRTTRGRRRG
jgi:hypothetical protein